MYYLRSRYYNAVLTRFVNADIYIKPAYNLFRYCNPNPVCLQDPDGTTEWLCCYYDPFDDPLNVNRSFFTGGMMTAYSGNAYSDIGDSSYVTDAMATSGHSHTPGETTVIGGGHAGEVHKNYINNFIAELKGTGQYRTIFGDRALKTAGQNGGWRPDIIAVPWEGPVECWEVASPSQALGSTGYDALLNKIVQMQEANPNVIFHDIITWEEISQ